MGLAGFPSSIADRERTVRWNVRWNVRMFDRRLRKTTCCRNTRCTAGYARYTRAPCARPLSAWPPAAYMCVCIERLLYGSRWPACSAPILRRRTARGPHAHPSHDALRTAIHSTMLCAPPVLAHRRTHGLGSLQHPRACLAHTYTRTHAHTVLAVCVRSRHSLGRGGRVWTTTHKST